MEEDEAKAMQPKTIQRGGRQSTGLPPRDLGRGGQGSYNSGSF